MTHKSPLLLLPLVLLALSQACGQGETTPPPDDSGGDAGGPTTSSGGSNSSGGRGNASGGRNSSSGGTNPSTGGDSGSSTGGTGTHPLPNEAGCPEIEEEPASTIYFCDCAAGADASCVAGNDSNSGSKGSPKRTFAQVYEAFNDLEAGQTIALCRGGSFTFTGSSQWYNYRCSADEPCTVIDYTPDGGSEDLPRPIVTKEGGGNLFDVQNPSGARVDGGYRFLNLDLRSGGGGFGFFFYNDVEDVLVCGVSIDGFSIGVHIGDSNTPEGGADGFHRNIVIQNSVITNNRTQGFLGGCDDCGLVYNKFENNGFGEAFSDHNVYVSNSDHANGMYIAYNDLYHSTIIDGRCRGNSLVVHGVFNDLLIEGNTVREDVGGVDSGCWGITADQGYASAENFARVTIRNNTVINLGNVSIGVSLCQDCVIENNIVIQEQNGGGTLIAVPNKEVEGNSDGAVNAVTVRNNTLYAAGGGNVTGISVGQQGTGHSVYNNTIYYTAGGGQRRCFAYPNLNDSAFTIRDYNVCYGAGGTNWAGGGGGGTLSAFQSATGADQNSLDADPLFTSLVAPYDFTPTASSPLVDAALDSDEAPAPADDATSADRDNSPDIGAIER